MEYIDVIVTVVSILIAIVIIIFIILKGKKVKISDVSFGPVTAKITEKIEYVDKIELLSVPLAGCAGEILSPTLKILLKDSDGRPITAKKIRLEFYNENGLVSSKNYSGKISAVSDINGVIEFDDLVLKRTGQFQIHIPVDNIIEVTDEIDIFPPGLNIDFWNEVVGTEKYEEKLNRALRFARTNLK